MNSLAQLERGAMAEETAPLEDLLEAMAQHGRICLIQADDGHWGCDCRRVSARGLVHFTIGTGASPREAAEACYAKLQAAVGA